MTFKENNRKIHISTITCMKMKSFILKYASKIMFYYVNIACYHTPQLKNLSMGAGPAWMRRGTQGHVAAPRGPTQRAYVARIHYILFIY